MVQMLFLERMRFSGTCQIAIAKQIKETLDRQCGPPWHCVIGEGFSYSVDAQVDAHILCFYQGDIAVLCFKS
ncbi:hypothetical protein Esti_005497 [Eimeria stiedai]